MTELLNVVNDIRINAGSTPLAKLPTGSNIRQVVEAALGGLYNSDLCVVDTVDIEWYKVVEHDDDGGPEVEYLFVLPIPETLGKYLA